MRGWAAGKIVPTEVRRRSQTGSSSSIPSQSSFTRRYLRLPHRPIPPDENFAFGDYLVVKKRMKTNEHATFDTRLVFNCFSRRHFNGIFDAASYRECSASEVGPRENAPLMTDPRWRQIGASQNRQLALLAELGPHWRQFGATLPILSLSTFVNRYLCLPHRSIPPGNHPFGIWRT
jgi:hypothetical protein